VVAASVGLAAAVILAAVAREEVGKRWTIISEHLLTI
jgi:hypothetical protein